MSFLIIFISYKQKYTEEYTSAMTIIIFLLMQ